jgi:hypothetical protein
MTDQHKPSPRPTFEGTQAPDPEQTPRQRAEQIARDTPILSPAAIAALSAEDLQRTFHELRVRQVELELQNEQLRRAQAENKAAQAGYLDLNDASISRVTSSDVTLSQQVEALQGRLERARAHHRGHPGLAVMVWTRWPLSLGQPSGGAAHRVYARGDHGDA